MDSQISELFRKLLLYLGLVFVAVLIIKYLFPELIKLLTSSKKSTLGYLKKERVMNFSEQALYINLQKTLGDKFIVLSKVRIEDFVEARSKSKSNLWSLRGKIKSRHVDFLICDLITTKPLLVIELDGASHKNTNRIKRDKFVNDLYNGINLKVEHVLRGGDFVQEAIRIKNILN